MLCAIAALVSHGGCSTLIGLGDVPAGSDVDGGGARSEGGASVDATLDGSTFDASALDSPQDGPAPALDAAQDAPSADATQDAPSADATDAGGGDADDGGTTPLDPRLDLPASGGAPCSPPGSTSVCAGPPQVCRIATASGGRCEGCTKCGNLHAPCDASSDCDILFQCFAGYCDGFCNLTTPQQCGLPTDCIDVGNATVGMCKYP
jgi:hypothetical protein